MTNNFAKRQMHSMLQINLHKSKAATANLGHVLSKGNTKICLAQEPYVYKSKIRGTPSTWKIFYDNSAIQPRACVLTSSDVKSTPLTQFQRKDVVAVLTEWKTTKVVYASVYMPYDQDCPSQEVVDLVKFCDDNKLPLVMGCDSNAHHPVWGSSDTNQRGKKLCEFIMETDLCCLNTGNKPTFVVKNRQEVIDVTFVSTYLVDKVIKWWVDDEESLSDHRFVKAEIDLGKPIPILVRNRRRTDWKTYQVYVKEHIKVLDELEISSAQEIDKAVESLNKVIMDGFEVACPLKQVKLKKTKTPFWNRDLSFLRKDTRKNWKVYTKNKSEENWEHYCKSRNVYSKALKKAQKESWEDYCSSIESTAESSRLCKVLKDDKFIKLGRLETPNGYTLNEQESVKELLDQHFPADANLRETQLSLEGIDTSEADKIVTEDLVEKAVLRFGPFKAAGEDGIFPKLLQAVIHTIKIPLTKVLKACLIYGYIPLAWRKTRVVFLPKPGKTNYEKASSWRPISLMSFELKTLERLIDWYVRVPDLLKTLQKNNQFAYMAGVSTDAAIHQLVARAEGALKTNESAICVFLDIKGAFNEITFAELEAAMVWHNIPVLCQRFISRMLRIRTVTSQGVAKLVERGCPQGGILSPLLWVLVADRLLRTLRTSYPQVYSAGYADDIAVLSRGPDDSIVREHAQACLKLANKWAKDVGLGLAVDKTVVLLFSRKKTSPAPLWLNGKLIPFSRSAKYLGVTIDNKLNWNEHCVERAKKGMMALATCKRAVGSKWGLKPKVVLWIFKTIVRPVISYGCLSWCSATLTKTRVDTLERVQRSALMAISGAMRSTGTVGLEMFLGLEPIDLFIQTTALKTFLRLSSRDQWLGWYGRGHKGPTSHMDFCLNLVEQIPTLASDLDVSLVMAKKAINNWGRNSHLERWKAGSTSGHFRLFISDSNEKNQKICGLSRTALRLMVQVASGHNSLNCHLHRVGLAPSPACSCGQGEKTGFHLVTACDKYAYLRLMELGSARLSAEDLKSIPLPDLAHFIVRSGRLISSRGGSGNREVNTPSSQ